MLITNTLSWISHFGRNNSCEQLWCEGTNTEKPLKLLFAKRWRCFESLTLISHFYIGKSMCKLVAKLVSELDSTVNLWLLKMVKSDRKSTWKPKPDPTTLNLHFLIREPLCEPVAERLKALGCDFY